MATITLYKNRINGVGGLIDSIIKSVSNIDIQLSTLKTTLQGVDSSTCNLQDTVDSISSSSKSEKEKTEDLKRLNNKLADFINNTTRRDNSARDNINKEKKNFYTRYKHLKPECENKKTFLQKLCSAFISVEKWCRSTWEKIINYDYFNFLGKLIHKEWFRTIISDVVGLFYRAGGYTFIKWLANTGTKLALFNRKHPLLSCFIPGLSFLGNLAPDFFSITLSADMDDNGVYHIRPDCLQQYAHYSTGYDDVFRAAVNEASEGAITVDAHQSLVFWADLNKNDIKDEGEEFIIWSWKGDYTNLGAGAETGIYQVKDGEIDEYGNYIIENGEYSYIYAEINRDYSAKMSLDLYYDANADGRYSDVEELYSYNPSEDQWWITGFDPLVQNVRADDLRAVTTIDFSSYGEDADIMLSAFRDYNDGNDDFLIPSEDSDSYIVTLDW